MKKVYTQMSAEELARATRDLNRPSSAGAFRAMTAAERKEWKRISKPAARQRSDRDESTVRIVISIKPELLAEAHRLAQRSGSSLSALIAGSLQDKVSKQRRIA